MELGDGEVRRHAAHDMAVNDILGLYVPGDSVLLKVVRAEAGVAQERGSRAAFYAASVIGAMVRAFESRVSLLAAPNASIPLPVRLGPRSS